MAKVYVKSCVVCGDSFEARGSGSHRKICCNPECGRLRQLENQKRYQRTPKGRKAVQRANAKTRERKAWDNTFLEWNE